MTNSKPGLPGRNHITANSKTGRHFFVLLCLCAVLCGGFAAQQAQAAHTFVSKSSAAYATTNPFTFNFTCTNGATLLVLSIANAGATARTGGAPTYNGAALTQADQTRTATETNVELWYGLAPPTGSAYQISIPNTGSNEVSPVVSCYQAQAGASSALRTANGATGTSTNPTGPALTGLAAGDAIVAVAGSGLNAWAQTGLTGTLLYDVDTGNEGHGTQYLIKTDGANTAMSWTAASDDWAVVEAAFNERFPPNPPTLTLPANNATGVSVTPTWNITTTDPDGDNLKYQINLSTNSDFSAPVSTFNQVDSLEGWTAASYASGATAFSTGTATALPLLLGTTYYWRAWAIDYAGNNQFIQSTATNTFVTVGARFYASSSTAVNDESAWAAENLVGEDRDGFGHMQLVSTGTTVMAVFNDKNAGSYNLNYRIFSNSVWGSTLTAATGVLDATSAVQGNSFHYFSAVADSNNAVHLVYIDTSNNVKYISYTATDSGWSAPSLVAAGVGTVSNPALSFDAYNGAVHAFWIDSTSIKYSSRTTAAAWSTASNLKTALTSPSYLGSASSDTASIGIIWREGGGSSYTIGYATITLEAASGLSPPSAFSTASVSSTSVTASWQLASGATGYTMAVSVNTGNPPSPVYASSSTVLTTATIPGLCPTVTYYLFVRTDGETSSSEYTTTSTMTAPGDCGLRVYNGTGQTSIACQYQSGCDLVSPLRFFKSGVIYEIPLVSTDNPHRSAIRIQTPSGTKAVRQYP